ncbi:hypothetical protein ACFL4G_05995, partial [Thermodesulfobacteriota bacterium]
MKSMQKMETMVWTIALAAVVGLGSMIPVAMADIPQEINYQGYLTDDSGNPIDGGVEMLFAIYDQETDGSELWSEGPMTVPVDAGMYNVILGETTPLTPTLLDGPCWLEVIVEGEYLVPRERVTSTLFTIEAEEADKVDGMEGAALEESAEIDADISAHAGDADVHHTKTTNFTELTDTATDAQIPNDITINFAGSAGDANTVDGIEAADLEESAEIDGDITAHATVSDAHHNKTTSFADLTDAATDAQIPDDITINFAGSAGDANTVDGVEAADLEESAEIDADITAHAGDTSAHHTKTTSFTELNDTATDAQIPDDITINFAGSAGDANTVDGVEAADLEESAEIDADI